MHVKGIFTQFIWVPAHVSVEGNEQVDILAKQTLRIARVDMQVSLSKAEVKSFIKKYTQTTWQEYWDISESGRHLYQIQRHVGDGRKVGFKCGEENIITRLRIGHSGLNHTLHKIGKHPTGNCTHCNQPETVEHVLLHCKKYDTQRKNLSQSLRKAKHHDFTLTGLLGKSAGKIQYDIVKFIKETELDNRI